ncbi:inorganic phosphate transporter [Actinacidiphila oryziradicis]|uniref:Inorganic phosphate transporter n=1 Tax=Actinacidiphila oryziradicis TaxID=2571141 RepID=A0A4U0S272_9ACTN|nr:inorganic phosphate transporter [Actinacidiphila oryziradicis]
MVGLGALQGLPMSTTHVSIGAISGTAGTDLSRIKKKTVRDFAIAWLIAPPFAAAVAAVAYLCAETRRPGNATSR